MLWTCVFEGFSVAMVIVYSASTIDTNLQATCVVISSVNFRLQYHSTS